jgi:hypothetical protein
MPYTYKYEEFFKQNDIIFDLINWDRLHIEDNKELAYIDSKIGHQRNIFDYIKFRKFIINAISDSSYDKIVVFGVQLSFLLNKYLTNKYKNKYLIDIRDYNKLLRFFTIKRIVNNSCFTAISSPGFMEWLPSSNKYVISHNTKADNIHKYYDKNFTESCLTLSYIGSIRDSNVNIELIRDLCNSEKIQLEFHGEGVANTELIQFIKENKVKNVRITGRYISQEEKEFYQKSDIISILVPNTDINSKTLLTNRLYQAVIYGKPILANEGSYQATVIKKYKLGLVINKLENVEKQLIDYLKEFNSEEYNLGRKLFFEKVLQDNKKFENKLSDFININ